MIAIVIVGLRPCCSCCCCGGAPIALGVKEMLAMLLIGTVVGPGPRCYVVVCLLRFPLPPLSDCVPVVVVVVAADVVFQMHLEGRACWQ